MFNPRPSQLGALAFARDREASLISLAMGQGKTAAALWHADEIKANHTLVICPPTVRGVWRGQIPKHCRRNTEAVVLDRGSIRKRTEMAEQAWQHGGPIAVVVNYEAVWREPFRSWVLGHIWDLVICDEGHKLQADNRCTEMVCRLRPFADRRLSLTGTPLTQDPMSVWGQCAFLNPDLWGPREEFRERYENPDAIRLRKMIRQTDLMRAAAGWPPTEIKSSWKQTLRPTHHTKAYLERLSRIAYRAETTELNLPPKQVEIRRFRLSASAQTAYISMRDWLCAELDNGGWCFAAHVWSSIVRLQQITSGYLPDQAGTIVPLDHGKADLLRDILSGANEPVVVVCRYTHDLTVVEQIATDLHRRYGEISQRRHDGLSDIGTMADNLDVVGMQEQAGGNGIDLTRARILVAYSLSWSRADWVQSIARVHRPPQDRPVTVFVLAAEETIDEGLLLTLDVRSEIVDEVMLGLLDPVEGITGESVACEASGYATPPRLRGSLPADFLSHDGAILGGLCR